MNEAEILQQLESFSPAQLDNVMERISFLRHTRERDELTEGQRQVLEKRVAQYERDGNKGEPWSVAREKILARIKK